MKRFLLLPLFLCAACQAAPPPGDRVVLLGDDARVSLAATCNEACAPYRDGQITTPGIRASASEAANAARAAKHGILVVDVAQGPLPITREHVLIARQAGVPALSILLVNTAALDGMDDKQELIELEVLEVRELLDKYEMRGDTAEVFFDRPGLKALMQKTVPLAPRASGRADASRGTRLSTFVYHLGTDESGRVEPIAQGQRVVVWIDGHSVHGEARVGTSIAPGGVGDVGLTLDQPVEVAPGVRFFIEHDGRIVTAGVVVSVEG